MGSQTDSQVSSQVHASQNIQMYCDNHVSICVDRVDLGDQMMKDLHQLAYEFELDQSQRKLLQVGGQTIRKLNASRTFCLARAEERSWSIVSVQCSVCVCGGGRELYLYLFLFALLLASGVDVCVYRDCDFIALS